MATLNYKGEESSQSKIRRKKKKAETTGGLIKGLRQNRNRMPTKGSEYLKGQMSEYGHNRAGKYG